MPEAPSVELGDQVESLTKLFEVHFTKPTLARYLAIMEIIYMRSLHMDAIRQKEYLAEELADMAKLDAAVRQSSEIAKMIRGVSALTTPKRKRRVRR